MKSRIISMIAAGAVATVGLSAPAKADDELLRFIVGAAVIGAIVHSANNGNNVAVTHGNHHKPKIKKKHRKHAHKPKQCLVRKWTNNGWKKRYDKNCMAHYGWHRHSGQGWHTHRRHAHR